MKAAVFYILQFVPPVTRITSQNLSVSTSCLPKTVKDALELAPSLVKTAFFMYFNASLKKIIALNSIFLFQCTHI